MPHLVTCNLEVFDETTTGTLPDDSGEPEQATARLKPGHDEHCFVVMPSGHTTSERRWFKGWYQVVILPSHHERQGYLPILGGRARSSRVLSMTKSAPILPLTPW